MFLLGFMIQLTQAFKMFKHNKGNGNVDVLMIYEIINKSPVRCLKIIIKYS